MKATLVVLLFTVFGAKANQYLESLYCQDFEQDEDRCQSNGKDEGCQVLFQDNLAECQDTRVKLHRNLPEGFKAKLYQTSEECSLPDLEQNVENFGFRPIKEPEESTDELNFGQVRVQECGLVNLAVVLTNPDAGYVEHLVS